MPNIIWAEVVKKDISNREVAKIMILDILEWREKKFMWPMTIIDEDSLAHPQLIRIKA